MDAGVSEDHAHVYSEAVRRGGTLVSVRTDDSRVEKVQSILDRYQSIDSIRQGAEYKKTGWKQFDPKAQPYNHDETEIERVRRVSQSPTHRSACYSAACSSLSALSFRPHK
jgi:hypothetical protein